MVQVFSVILFFMGIFLLIYFAKVYHKSLNLLREDLKDKENVIYQQNLMEEPNITYSELIATLFQPLEYDIEVDGLLIEHKIHNAEKIPTYDIAHSNYKKAYQYDANGMIIKIIYKRIDK